MELKKEVKAGLGEQTAEQFVETKIREIRDEVQNKKVICGLSGGVDSSVCAVLVHKAIGDNLTCIFVNHGLLRKNEANQVEEVFGRQFKMKLICIDAQKRFLDKLAGVTNPEQKRKIIGEEFIRVFEDEAKRLESTEGKIDYLLQGTIYPDIIESGRDGAKLVKSHHNVGGLPEKMAFSLLEPVKMLYKNEVREVGKALGISPEVVWRQPFPGPGLGVRCLGEITEEKLSLIRESDAILREEINLAGLASEVWQYFTVLPNVQSVGVRDGNRTYEHMIGIRAITSKDAMTANWARLPYELLEKISDRIMNEVAGVNRVVFDITKKPSGTIEWE